MKKFIGQLVGGETINVRVNGSLTKSACILKAIEFRQLGEEFEHAVLVLESEEGEFIQTWYTVETVEVLS